jgi:tRNA1(Val) A37 N6-methylase TrmN6
LYDRQKEEAKRILLEFVENGNLREVIENNVKIEE